MYGLRSTVSLYTRMAVVSASLATSTIPATALAPAEEAKASVQAAGIESAGTVATTSLALVPLVLGYFSMHTSRKPHHVQRGRRIDSQFQAYERSIPVRLASEARSGGAL
jgi:hypothetical protein